MVRTNRLVLLWVISLGLLMVSVLYVSHQQTRLAVEQAYVEDLDVFTNSLVQDIQRHDRRKSKRRRKNPRRDKKKDNDSDNNNGNKRKHPLKKKKVQLRWRNDENRPPLDSLISDNESGILATVSPLLDFAILGHAKCATSFIMNWLRVHEEVQIFDYEVCDLNEGKPAELVKQLYQDLPIGDYKRGFKCPGHFSRGPLRSIRQHFGNAVLIVGLRHPVRWFESFYNFRVRHPRIQGALPEPSALIGECTTEAQGVCTVRAEFHGNLAMFGKTNLTDPEEWKLMRIREKYQNISPVHNPIFLYDVNQLYDKNETRTALLKSDLRDFLGLKADMPSPVIKKSSKPKFHKIDICDAEFDALRTELLDIGERASTWIRTYFLESDEVVVSSRYFFEEALEEWKTDPCTGTVLATAEDGE